jgi:hypothetical protein
MDSTKGIIENGCDQLLLLAHLSQEIHAIPASGLFLLFEGLSGSGKTSRIVAWAKENNLHLVLENGATYFSEEKELQKPEGKARLYPQFFQKLNRQKDTLLFLDEYQLLSPALLAFFEPIIQNLAIPTADGKSLARIPNLLAVVGAKTIGFRFPEK